MNLQRYKLIQKVSLTTKTTGFSLVELVLSGALFSMIALSLVGAILYSQQSSVEQSLRLKGSSLATAGITAVRNIRDNDYANLNDGTYGVIKTDAVWSLSAGSDVTDGFTRTVTIATIDAQTKKVSVTVSLPGMMANRPPVTLSTFVTDWKTATTIQSDGMLVYANASAGSDVVQYKSYNSQGNQWSSADSVADIDTTSTNKQPLVVRIYTSPVRNEKILVARYFDGSNQYIYAQVYNGTIWAHVVLLSTWAGSENTTMQNFDGSYDQAGNFLAVFSNNTSVPQSRIWNGSTWGAQYPLKNLIGGGTNQNQIILKKRPDSNEAMAVFFTEHGRTVTQYYNGNGYSTSNWSNSSEQGPNAPFLDRQQVDFVWSADNPLIGALVYPHKKKEDSINIRIWTADGTGGGNWSNATPSPSFTNYVGVMSVSSMKGTNQFLACQKADTGAVQCYRCTSAAVWVPSSYLQLTTNSGSGAVQSFAIGDEQGGGSYAFGLFSDLTAVPKLAKYNKTTSLWEGTSALPALSQTLTTLKVVDQHDTNKSMGLLVDAAGGLYTHILNDPTNNVTSQSNTNNTAASEWFDFVWGGGL
jgi:type II secretory pathway pseudopilin PulG